MPKGRRRLSRLTQLVSIGVLFVGAGAGTAFAGSDQPTAGTSWASLAAAASDQTPQRILAHIDLSDQTMMVYVDQVLRHTFKVSTGRGRYRTPTGKWNAGWLASKWRSRKYNNAPMPWSVFCDNGYAVHGTTAIKRLGSPASHGCIRLHPDHARIFYKLVETAGKKNSVILVVN